MALPGAIVALASLGVAVNFRDWIRLLTKRGQRLGTTPYGFLFRGRYSELLIRALALQVMAVALVFPAALSLALGGPALLFALPVAGYILVFFSTLLWITIDKIRTQLRESDAPVFGVLMFLVFITMGGTFTLFGNMAKLLFAQAGR